MAIAWLRPVLPAGAIILGALLVALFVAGPAKADPNELRIEPAALEVAPGGSVTVQLIADPPATSLTVWGIDIQFDPEVLTTDDFGCDPLDPLPNSTTIAVCVTGSSVGDDDSPDLVKVLGGLVFKETESGHQAGDGLVDETVLADITFDVTGEPGDCTDLRLFIRFHIDVDSQETNPALLDGLVCIEGGAPPGGTAVPTQAVPRTPDPTAPGGDIEQPTLPPFEDVETDAPVNGDETPGEGTEGASPGESVSGASGTGTGRGETPGGFPGSDGDSDDDGGLGTVFWALLGLGALLVVSGVTWAVVRGRSDAGGASRDA
ncbi:MAG TPA: hypothetical protein VMR52_07720 [Dehalococcoidia bacterium]|nr:hypothetical protein [Dehalococcoidia bacterium]